MLMKKTNESDKETRILEQTLDSLEVRREAPRSVFILLLLLYIVATLTVSLTAGSQKEIMIGSAPVSVYTFAGIFASLSNLCIILMVFFCGKTGFFASIIAMALQIPMILMGIFVKGNYTSLPGLFVDVLTVIDIIVIF